MAAYANPQSTSPSSRSSSSMPIRFWGATDKGRKREGNEDSVYPHSGLETFEPSAERLKRRGQLLIVADGVGGAQAGAEASRWAIRVAVERYYDSTGADPGEDLRTAIQIANTSLHQYLQSTGVTEAGSTMTSVVIHRDMLHVANVGDSRVYLLREGKLEKQTIDHTLTQQKVQAGIIRPEQAATDSGQSVLTRSMGGGPTVDVDLFPPRKLQQGDVVLLCSDGLTDMLDDATIARILSANPPRRAAEKLIAAANRAGGFDNISVVIAQIGGRSKGAGGLLGGVGTSIARLKTWQMLVLGGLATAVILVCLGLGWLAANWILFDGDGDPTPTPALTETLTATPEYSVPTDTPTPVPTDTAPAAQPTSTPRPTSTPTPTPTPNPDPDGDGFVGGADQCPFVWGTADGCPDRDGDGVRDQIDACPDDYAETENGCPPPSTAPPAPPPPQPTNPGSTQPPPPTDTPMPEPTATKEVPPP